MNNIVIQNTGKIELDSTSIHHVYLYNPATTTTTTTATGGHFTMKTSDTSSSFKFDLSESFYVLNSGAILHWEVTGAVTASYDGNYPTFDFSEPGEKIITVTSADNLVNLIELSIFNLPITSLDVSNLVNLTYLYLDNLSIASLDVSNLVNLTALSIYDLSIASLDVSNLLNLTHLNISNISIASLDVSNLLNLTYLYLYNLSITSLELNNILDQLIVIGNNGYYIKVTTTCADADKIAALEVIWDNVYITPCNNPATTTTTTTATGGHFTMKTSDTSSSFKFEYLESFYVANSGATLHWEVTGAVTASYDGNYPTFDFSAPGEKIITVTSADNLVNLTVLEIHNLSITSIDVSNLVNLTNLVIYELSITSLDVSNLVNLTVLAIIDLSITSLDISNLTNLTDLAIIDLSITSLDISNLVNLTFLQLENLSITSLELNNILDQLIAIGNNGYVASISPTCADASKIAALDAIWDDVYITPCN